MSEDRFKNRKEALAWLQAKGQGWSWTKPTTGTIHQNNVQIRSFDHSYPDFPLLDLGRGLDTNVPFNGQIGDVFGVVSAHPQAAAALTAAQAYVAAKHGITLA